MSQRAEKPIAPECAACAAVQRKKGTTHCWSEPNAGPPAPGACPTHAWEGAVAGTLPGYVDGSDDARLALTAAKVEGLCYEKVGDGSIHARWTRVEDTIAFARLMGWRRVGIATCIGLLDESARLVEVLEAQGLEPIPVCCKVGSVDKERLGVKDAEKVRPGTFEPACNPVAQARILNELGTDMNVIVGLCVGHDMLFSKHSAAPVTTLVVKDRVTGHNPVAALYGQNFYYRRLAKGPIRIPEE
ncbi:MAG TPA: DUF1847 domain-containing protein [Anaeromyxobacteraceae bacterium]|nr:DUF1847 domain-containing protein [Anaeromyxobacteraceae bacterium]